MCFWIQALNNLQSTYQGFGMVTSENVFKVSPLGTHGLSTVLSRLLIPTIYLYAS